jgi:hypothetical protein
MKANVNPRSGVSIGRRLPPKRGPYWTPIQRQLRLFKKLWTMYHYYEGYVLKRPKGMHKKNLSKTDRGTGGRLSSYMRRRLRSACCGYCPGSIVSNKYSPCRKTTHGVPKTFLILFLESRQSSQSSSAVRDARLSHWVLEQQVARPSRQLRPRPYFAFQFHTFQFDYWGLSVRQRCKAPQTAKNHRFIAISRPFTQRYLLRRGKYIENSLGTVARTTLRHPLCAQIGRRRAASKSTRGAKRI